MSIKNTLVTGAYGLIGGFVYKYLQQFPDAYEAHALARSRKPSFKVTEIADWTGEIPDDRFHLADVGDFDAVQRAVSGMDVVIHFAAAVSAKADWENVLHSNLIGIYNIFEASRQAGVKRVIFASTIQVVWGHRSEEPYRAILQKNDDAIPPEVPFLPTNAAPLPTNLYSSSKVWGEAIAHMYAHKYEMSCICLRIGAVPTGNRPRSNNSADWCSHRDLAQLVKCCVDAPEGVRFDTFYAVSNNRYRWLDIDHAREVVGYVPQDRAENYFQEG